MVIVGAFLAWYVTGGHQVDSLIAVVSAFTGLLALPAAVIAVVRSSKSESGPAPLEDVADQLAKGVREQWEAEALLLGFRHGFATGLGIWLLGGLPWTVAATLLASSARERKPSSGIRWSWRGRSWLTVGLTFGLIFGIFFSFWLGEDILQGFTFALAGGLPFGLMGGLRSVHPDLSKAVGPGVVLAQDRRTLIVITLAGVLAGVLASTLTIAFDLWFAYRPMVLLRYGYGFAIGLPVGLMLGFVRSVWMEYLVARIRLAVVRRVPWRFISFLADAHERRGVLRQVGTAYQFRHIDLQRHLAGHKP